MSPLAWTWRARQAPAGGPREMLRHADALYNLARYLTRHPSDAEDLVQETYAHAVEAWDRLLPGSNVKAWLFRILRNAYISGYRRGQREPAPEPYDTTEENAPGRPEDEAFLGDRELGRLRGLVGADIEAALRKLSDDARTIVLLDLDGFTEGEVAQVLGCAVGTVKSRLSRARAALRQLLSDYATEEGP